MEFHTLLSPRFYPLFFHYLRSEMGLMGCYAFTPPLIFQGWTTRGGGKTAWNSIDHVVHFYQHFVYFFHLFVAIKHKSSRLARTKIWWKKSKKLYSSETSKNNIFGRMKNLQKINFFTITKGSLHTPPGGGGGVWRICRFLTSVPAFYVDFCPMG